jgi:hypothetical protein
MFGRIFGRRKDEPDQAVCAQCGRTLLAGEWTQKVVDADGEELLICSLCGQTRATSGSEPVITGTTPAGNGRVRDSREQAREPRAEARDPRAESNAFWKALKDKDAAIEGLQAQLARVEAEKQELAGQLARVRAQGAGVPAGPAERPPIETIPAAPLIPSVAAGTVAATTGATRSTSDSSEPGERTWGETPAEFAAELAALRDEVAPADVAPAEPSATPASPLESTQPIPALDEEEPGDVAESHATAETEPAGAFAAPLDAEAPPAVPAPAETDGVSAIAAETTALAASSAFAVEAETTEASAAEPPLSARDLEAEAASLTLLQRGVDLLNVSRVPHKIAETNEQLGLPSVHVGSDGATTAVTFMWSMGWYRFHVDSDSGDVRMVDRGYDELTDLRPNAGVRADGTVQLAPAQISRAAAQRPQPEPQPAAQPVATDADPEPEPPSVAAQKPPEILSKSLLGQRSDDDAASWEKTQARDFDWDR